MDINRKREIARNWYHRHKTLKGKTIKKVVCAICGKEFETDTNKKYCSVACRRQARKNTVKKYDDTHKEQHKAYYKEYMKKNGVLVRERRKANYIKNNLKEKQAIYRQEHKKEINERIKRWRKQNTEKVAKIKQRYKEKNIDIIRANARKNKRTYCKDINKRLKFNISRAFNRYFKKTTTTAKYMEYFNYTIEDLKQHLQKQFKSDMNWENYGKLWNIDHKIPQSWFDFSKKEEIRRCWQLDNLQPLYAKENFSKGNRYAN